LFTLYMVPCNVHAYMSINFVTVVIYDRKTVIALAHDLKKLQNLKKIVFKR
jgi:hypothetical protein